MVVIKIFYSSKKAREVDKEEVSLKISMETMNRQFVKYVVVEEEEEEEPEVSTECSHMCGKCSADSIASFSSALGWKLEKTVDYYMDFTRLVVDSVSEVVDYWGNFE
ncbi:hypothetical protein MKW92_032844 [Papaver armeniacum]|nr:hypothetical protein MKW92_032844 [Papaver armeniacum]